MMVDTRIYGYVTDGAAYHPDCVPEGVSVEDPETATALFSYDDDWDDGLSCDGCSEFIFEPYVTESPEDDDEDIIPVSVEAESLPLFIGS